MSNFVESFKHTYRSRSVGSLYQCDVSLQLIVSPVYP